MALDIEDVRLLRNPRFRRLLEARLAGQIAQNATLYTLLILVVQDTESSFQSTLLIISYTLPAMFLAIPAGALADALPKRLTLTTGLLLKTAVAGGLVLFSGDTLSIFLLAAALSAVSQLYSPAESATVTGIVRRDQLPAANALMVLTLVLGQILGIAAIAPLLLRTVGPSSVFLVATALFALASYIIGWMASDFSREEEAATRRAGFINAMQEGFRVLRQDRHAYLAIVYLTIGTMLLKVVVILLPQYTHDVLRISTRDTVFVAAPAAIGAGAGMLFAPLVIRRIGGWRVVAAGLVLLLLGMLGLGLVVYVRDFIESNINLGIGFVEREVGVSSVITVSMLLAIPLGFAYSLLSIGARVVMNERAAPETQGRLFAIQIALGDLVSLVPLLVVGALADVAGVRATLLAAAAAAVLAAAYLTFSRRLGPGQPLPRQALDTRPAG